MNLTRVTAPASNPVTLTEAKAHLRVDDSDSDTLISALIAAAVAMIDGPHGIGIAMMTQTWRYVLDCFPAYIRLPLTPVQDGILSDSPAGVTITYVDTAGATQTLATSDYRLSGGILEPAYGEAWPGTRTVRGAVTIDFEVGWGDADDVPQDLKAAILLTVGHLYEHREAVVADATPAELPLGVKAILDRYRNGWAGA